MINELVIAAGGQDGRVIRKRYLLQPLLLEVNLNINTLKAKRLAPVMVPALLGNKFVINTHASPMPLARWLMRRGMLKAIYGYRDPRAALLSAFEYGQRGYERYSAKEFLNLKNIDDAIDLLKFYVNVWAEWMACEQALQIRYEDMLTDYDREVERLLPFLGIEEVNEAVTEVVEKYRPGKVVKGHKGLHFEKGQAERFRKVFTEEQMAAVNAAFAPYLEKMGYTI